MRALRRFLYDLLATEAFFVILFLIMLTAFGVMLKVILAV